MIEQLRPAAHREQVQHRAHGKRPLACGPLFIDGAVHIERALMHLATLAVAGAGVAAAAVDLLHKHPNFGQAQGETAVFRGNHHCQPAGVGRMRKTVSRYPRSASILWKHSSE